MNQRKNWTKDEELVLLRAVKKNPQQKLNVTLMAVAQELDRNIDSVYNRYYGRIKKVENPRKWTKEADKKLVKAVKDNPYNRREAFRQVAQELNLSFYAVQKHWYTKDFEVCTLAFSPKKMFKNRTSYVEGKNTYAPTTPKNRFWNRIKEIFGL